MQFFIDQLGSKNPRMVWGAMIALATNAGLVSVDIWSHREKFEGLIKTDTAIARLE